MSLENLAIRYLLHGCSDKYDDNNDLYIMSQEDDLWRNIAEQLLSINQESWRLIDKNLGKSIPPKQYKQLKLTSFTPEAIIKLIQRIGEKSLKNINIGSKEKEQLLVKIGQQGIYQDLWRNLPLHETTRGHLVTINENTFLENPDFTLASRLESEEIITLIKQKNQNHLLLDLQEREIPHWDNISAMNLLLKLPNIHDYSDLILLIWKANNNDFKRKYQDRLKESNWIKLSSGNAIAPKAVLKLPNELTKYTKQIVNLYDEYYAPSELAFSESESKAIDRLFDEWDEEQVIEFLLEQENPSEYLKIIIHTLEILCNKKDISNQTLQYLQNKQWLISEQNKVIAPVQVLDISKFKVQKEAKDILKSSDYVTVEMLHSSIKQNESVLNWLIKNLFIKEIKALAIIGENIGNLPDYYLGNFIPPNNFPLEDALEIFKEIDSTTLPCWSLVDKVVKYSSPENCKRYILPYILQNIEDEQIIDLLNWLSQYKGTDEPARQLYNKYLRIVVTQDNFCQEILTKICLLNRSGEWKSPNELSTYIDNIHESYLVEQEQEDILISSPSYLQRGLTENSNKENIEIREVDSNKNQYDVLIEYFKDWQGHINSEAIGAFLCLIAGNTETIKKLAQSFLGKRDFDDVLNRLIGNNSSRSFKIDVQTKDNYKKTLMSLTRESFTALIKSQEQIENFFLNKLDNVTEQLVIIPINIASDIPNDRLPKILKNSVSILLKRVYEIHEPTESLDKVWTDLTQSEQLDIQVTRGVILDSVQATIQFLGVHQKNEQVKQQINGIDKAIQLREDYRNRKVDERVQQQEQIINNLKQNLGSILDEENSQIALDILAAVRKKIGHGHFGYDKTSIPFEIFQNADDALVALEMMGQNQPLPESRIQFILMSQSTTRESKFDTIMMMYRGRPINCFIHPDYRDRNFRDKGFEQDLQKMLSFNYSDKSSNNNDSEYDNTVTGKFGLGFKSVHLICREPHIRSHRLSFKIVGGLLPSKLTRLDEINFNHQLKAFNFLEHSDCTVIKLKLDPDLKIEIDDILGEFKKLIGLLLIFARKIKTCKIFNPKQELPDEYKWQPHYFLGEKIFEIGQIKINHFQANALCLKLGDIGHFLIILNVSNNKLTRALPKDIPNIWVTAPTHEKLELNFIVNAPFDVNTGRSTIIESSHNLTIANQLGTLLGENLCKLFELTNNNWDSFQQLLHLGNITTYQFWEFIWQELAVSLLDKPAKGIFGLMRNIVGSERKGMGYCVIHCPTLPNGLSEKYKCLVSATEIQYIIEGVLKEESCFNQIFQWEIVRDNYPNNIIINGNIWRQFKKLLTFGVATQQFSPQPLFLSNILQGLLEQSKANPENANQIGELINLDFLEKVKVNGREEYDKLYQYLLEINFLNQKNGYELTKNLLHKNSEDNEEKLLSAFAPLEYLLSDEYNNHGLKFYYACRQKTLSSSLELEELIKWIKQTSENCRQKVIDYVFHIKYGQLKTDLVNKLCDEFEWIKNAIQIGSNIPIFDNTDGDEDDSTADPENAKKYGEIAEKEAVKFYLQHYNQVKNCNDYNPQNPGFDLECSHPNLPQDNLPNIKVEVKAITYERSNIRITKTEWNIMIENKNNYELFIYAHKHGSPIQLIRIKQIWLTLKKSLEKEKNISKYTYDSKKIEPLIGLQQNSEGTGNDILLDWHRLFWDFTHENIEKFMYPSL